MLRPDSVVPTPYTLSHKAGHTSYAQVMADLSLVAACLAGLLALLYLYKNRRSSPKAPGAPPQVPSPFSAVLVSLCSWD